MNIVAIDLGKFNSMACFFNTNTRESRFQLIRTERHYLITLLKSEPVDLVVMEACSGSGWVSDLCQQLDLRTLVCSTHEEAWRWRNVKRKTDRDDALKLAQLAAVALARKILVVAWAMLRDETDYDPDKLLPAA